MPHQLAALLGWVIGNGNAVNALTTASVILLPVPIYRLAQRYFGTAAAGRAALLAVVTPSILLAGYAFGQLPTLFALDAGLFTADALAAFLRRGGAPRLILVLSLAGVTVTAHHATFIFFFPPLLGTIFLAELLAEKPGKDSARAASTRTRPRPGAKTATVPRLFARGAIAATGLGLTAILAILPFWVWHATEYVSQVPIDHQSRHSFLQDLVAQDLFFWAEHGVLVAVLVLAVPLLVRRARQACPWYVLGAFLLIVGLGGTTPLPRILFGEQWNWLTYDRFSVWADIPLVLLLGAATARLLDEVPRPRHIAHVAWWTTFCFLGFYAAVDSFIPALVQTEPPPIDPRPIIAFLGHANNQRWRYLTLGMGDQAALLNASADAGTLDGDYYTARRLPILTQSGIAQIDFSLLWDPAARTLRQLLSDPRPYSLRWAFTRDPAYEQILAQAGWRERTTLSDDVQVWEAAQPVPPTGPPPSTSILLGIWWGVAPLAMLLSVAPAWWWVRRSCER
ncbi:MAG TPA: hypothetical protein VNL16_08260 [Chloroflexota bacterium]|nr:hypothetical protein [Chloroflexota bacterium]